MNRWSSIAVAAVALSGAYANVAAATTRVVGPGHPYAKPCQAIAASGPGDTVQIDAAGNGTYDGDVCASGVAGLTIEGVNGRAHIDAAGKSSGGKAIWVLSGAGMVVRNVELSGAKVPDGNGAGIRLEGGDLTLIGSAFRDNQDGILVANDPAIDLTIDSSEFAGNGAGDGQTHNIYVGAIRSFTMRYSWSHGAKVGHLVKSRARTNTIMYNRLTGEGGTGSYELELPNGGPTTVVGNVIQQGPNTDNPTLLAYGMEGATTPDSRLTAVNNTFVNDRPGSATAIAVHGSVTAPAVVANNISVGASTFVSQPSAQLTANCLVPDPRFVDRAAYDYHLQEASPCRDAASPTPAGGLPTEQYVYNFGHAPRGVVGDRPDAGAFEWAPAGGAGAGGGAPPPAGAQPPTAAKPVRLSVTSMRVRRDGSLRLGLRVAGAGALSGRATANAGGRRVTYARGSAKAKRAGAIALILRPTKAGRRALRHRRRLTVAVALTHRTPAGATTRRSKTLTLKLARAGARRG